MLGKRILTALIGVPVAVLVINHGEWLFVAAVLVLAAAAWHEFAKMLAVKQIHVFYGLGLAACLGIIGCAWLGAFHEMIALLFVCTLVTLLRMIIKTETFTPVDAAFSLLGIYYIILAFAYLVLLRFTDNFLTIPTAWGDLSAGAAYLWLAFIGTWASDTFAFFVGTYLGKHKLCPAVSPKKTVEGVMGGAVGSAAVVTLLAAAFHIPLWHGLAMGILVGVVAPVGDLAESALKRFAGVKDSGSLLPGHGGVLDRFDSILFTVPVIYYYMNSFVLG